MSIDDRDASGLSRRGFLGGAAATTLWGALSGCGPDRVGPPNVLLIVADGLGYECLARERETFGWAAKGAFGIRASPG